MEMVRYWLRRDMSRARVTVGKDKSYHMLIDGEQYPYPGFPRGYLMNKFHEELEYPILSRLKHAVKNKIFNEPYAEIERLSKETNVHMVPKEHMAPAVRHIWETFEKMEEMEVTTDMKERIRLIRNVLCFIMQEDDSYRFRFQLFLDLIDQKKVRLSKGDMYYLRAKYYKPDRYKKILGRIFDGFQY